MAWDFSFDKIHSVYDFSETIRSAAHLIKYKGKGKLAYQLGLLSGKVIPKQLLGQCDICIPVPLHSSRERQRGYNQSELFARGIIDSGDFKLQIECNLLLRNRKTGTQTKLDRTERAKNLTGAFSVPSEKGGVLKNKAVLLVDDIVTTGATTEACATALMECNCASVTVLSLARD
ncbi:competence protein ComF [Chitinispirillum alkaliphilum]|nr:competence protein ComF [Chitinispirillum alkaliphilum]